MARNTPLWVKVASVEDRWGSQLFGILICEDRDEAIVTEAKEFLSRHLDRIEMDWRVEIRRLKGSLIGSTARVWELLDRPSHCIAIQLPSDSIPQRR
jgi:hypothetical protein